MLENRSLYNHGHVTIHTVPPCQRPKYRGQTGGKEEYRQTDYVLGGQHLGVDWLPLSNPDMHNRRSRAMEPPSIHHDTYTSP